MSYKTDKTDEDIDSLWLAATSSVDIEGSVGDYSKGIVDTLEWLFGLSDIAPNVNEVTVRRNLSTLTEDGFEGDDDDGD